MPTRKVNFFSKEEMNRGWKYFGVGIFTFGIDIIGLYILVEFLFLREFIAAAISFSIMITINYLLNRKFAFNGTKQDVRKAYRYFVLFALLGVFLVTTSMYLAVDVLNFDYLISRVVIAFIVSIITYFLNYFFSFKLHETEMKLN